MPRYFKTVDDETHEERWYLDKGVDSQGNLIVVLVEDEELLKKLSHAKS